MTTGINRHVSRETIQDRLRMARTTTMRYDDGYGITTNRASRQIARGIEKLANHVIEDGLMDEDERDAFSEFHNAILNDIDRQIVEFAEHIENEVRPARWAAAEKGA